jgi:hypothetical protein
MTMPNPEVLRDISFDAHNLLLGWQHMLPRDVCDSLRHIEEVAAKHADVLAATQYTAGENAVIAEVLRGHRELLKHTPGGHSTSLDQLRNLEIKAASLAFLEISHDA